MEAPYLQKAYQLARKRGGMVIGVAVPGDEIAALKEFRARHKVSYPIALDIKNGVYDRFELAFPSTVLVDRTGVIRLIEEGFEPGKFAATQARFAAWWPKQRGQRRPLSRRARGLRVGHRR